MKFSLLAHLVIAAVTLCAGLAQAEKADRSKPMNVEADKLRYDDQKQISVFTGHVVLTKGSILIRGARIEVRQDAQGNQFGLVSAEPGQLALFKQKREGLDEFIEGEGETIEYDGHADTVKFASRAQLRRYRGASLSDELSGALIVYNNTTDVFSIDGAPSPGGSATTPGRVRAMLMPRQETPLSVTPAAPQPPLRPSTTLGAEKK